jgi:hypothetical protein
MVNGVLENAGVYTQPTGEPTKVSTFDVTVAHSTDSVLSFSDISLNGNFYNGPRGGPATASGGPGGGPAVGLNLVLTFASSQVAGVITATLAEHYVDTIDSSNWWELGHITNTAQPAINNGVIVSLSGGSTRTVTGTSYLTALSLAATSRVAGLRGREGQHDGGRHPHRHHGRLQLHRRDRPHRGLRLAPAQVTTGSETPSVSGNATRPFGKSGSFSRTDRRQPSGSARGGRSGRHWRSGGGGRGGGGGGGGGR